jgi:transcription elongation GreA/GreB family factor
MPQVNGTRHWTHTPEGRRILAARSEAIKQKRETKRLNGRDKPMATRSRSQKLQPSKTHELVKLGAAVRLRELDKERTKLRSFLGIVE